MIETTGVADPGPIASTLALDSAIARHYRLGSIVTVVDALHGVQELERFAQARRQVAVADRIVITKTDVAEAAAVDDLTARLAELAPHALRRMASHGEIAGGRCLRGHPASGGARRACGDVVRRCARSRPPQHDHDHLAADAIVSTAIRLSAPLSWQRYAEWVQWMQRTFGERLLRMKGAVLMEDGTVQALHAVMHLFNAPVPMPALPRELGHGVIVVIAQHVSPALIEEARRRIEIPQSVLSS